MGIDFSKIARDAEEKLLSSLPRKNPWRERVRHPDRPKGLSPDSWWGCDWPERPADELVLWLYQCDGCLMHLAAAARVPAPEQARGIYGIGDPARFETYDDVTGRRIQCHGASTWVGIYVETCLWRTKNSTLPTWALRDVEQYLLPEPVPA